MTTMMNDRVNSNDCTHASNQHTINQQTTELSLGQRETLPSINSREMLELRRALRQAMQDSDEWVVEFDYCDSKGGRTRRVVSPIRFMGTDRVLGLCLSREEPRQFHLNRCRRPQLKRATEYLMPVPMLVFESPVEFSVKKE